MNFSGKFDTHFFETINSFDAELYNTIGPLYIVTKPRVTNVGIFPQEIRIINKLNNISDFHTYSTEIASIYWHSGNVLF